MGFGKYLLGAIGVAAAVVAAPVVLPMAAAGAAAVGGAAAAGAAAVGGAVATGAAAVGSVATAVGGAVAAGATAAGGALASSAVGGAVVSGAAAVGGVVGTAAGAVGLTSVATVAGTATGAAAVGTIATASTVAVGTSAVGVSNLMTAKEIVEAAERRYEAQKQKLDKKELQTTESLNALGELKLTAWESFKTFHTLASKIKNCKLLEGNASKESIAISKEELDKLEQLSISAIELLKVGPASLGAGALAGVAAYGGTLAIGTASTGTAIATLSGAAATKATMAALGGGSLASGGLGMAGGATVLGGVVAAPVLAVGGIFLAAKGSKKKKEAEEISVQADSAIGKMKSGISLLGKIDSTTKEMTTELRTLFDSYMVLLSDLENVVSVETNFKNFSTEQRNILEKNILITKILKKLTTTDIIVKKGQNQAVNSKDVKAVISESQEIRAQVA